MLRETSVRWIQQVFCQTIVSCHSDPFNSLAILKFLCKNYLMYILHSEKTTKLIWQKSTQKGTKITICTNLPNSLQKASFEMVKKIGRVPESLSCRKREEIANVFVLLPEHLPWLDWNFRSRKIGEKSGEIRTIYKHQENSNISGKPDRSFQ